ncbi:7tm 7 domain containing protein [Asbolus verrucosus]|uniref:Gustatory receptor n=1 Tax=Asbolus verrucosus TaxID=1661398 RepID=A0A482W3D1_ASBVE|nr:7tm 7 domain containing protein [Asbolus verrucosus]
MTRLSSPVSYKENYILSPLFRFAQICSLSVPGVAEKSAKFRWYTIYSVGIMVLILGFCFWSTTNKWKHSDQYSYYSVFLFDIITVILLSLISVLSIINSIFVKAKKVKILLANLMELDHLMDNNNSNFLKRRERTIIVELVAVHVFLMSLYTYDVFANILSFGLNYYTINIPHFINEYITTIEVLYISNYILSIKYKLTTLNISLINFVKKILQNIPKNHQSSSNLYNHPTLLSKHLEIHNKLCNMIDMVNDCFGLQIFGILFVGVIYTTYTIFLVLIYGSGKMTPENGVSGFYILFLYICVSLIYMIFGIMITVSCTAASLAARRTATVCYKLLLNVSVSPKSHEESMLRKELLLFAEQVSQRKICFNAGGFFTIDYNTLYTLFGSTAMNVIILLQFQKQGDKNVNVRQQLCTNFMNFDYDICDDCSDSSEGLAGFLCDLMCETVEECDETTPPSTTVLSTTAGASTAAPASEASTTPASSTEETSATT